MDSKIDITLTQDQLALPQGFRPVGSFCSETTYHGDDRGHCESVSRSRLEWARKGHTVIIIKFPSEMLSSIQPGEDKEGGDSDADNVSHQQLRRVGSRVVEVGNLVVRRSDRPSSTSILSWGQTVGGRHAVAGVPQRTSRCSWNRMVGRRRQRGPKLMRRRGCLEGRMGYDGPWSLGLGRRSGTVPTFVLPPGRLAFFFLPHLLDFPCTVLFSRDETCRCCLCVRLPGMIAQFSPPGLLPYRAGQKRVTSCACSVGYDGKTKSGSSSAWSSSGHRIT